MSDFINGATSDNRIMSQVKRILRNFVKEDKNLSKEHIDFLDEKSDSNSDEKNANDPILI